MLSETEFIEKLGIPLFDRESTLGSSDRVVVEFSNRLLRLWVYRYD